MLDDCSVLMYCTIIALVFDCVMEDGKKEQRDLIRYDTLHPNEDTSVGRSDISC